MNYLIKIGGIDVTNWIREIPSINYGRGGIGQLVEIPQITLIGDNTKGVFVPGGNNSILADDFNGDPVVIYKDDELIYEGELIDCDVSNYGRVCNLTVSAKVNKVLQPIVPGFTSPQKTFAELSQDLYTLFGVQCDRVSYGLAKTRQETYALQAIANIPIDSNSNLMTIQQFLANAGFCRHYFVGSVAYMDFEDIDPTPSPIYVFEDQHIIDISNYQTIQGEPWDGYQVNTLVGLADKVGTNPVPSLDVGIGNQFMVATLEMGYNWGDLMEQYSAKRRYSITIHLANGSYTSWLTLYSHFQVQSNLFGINKVFKVLSIDESSKLGMVITGESL